MITENDIRDAKRAYYREWKRRNRDKVRASNKRYWAKYAARKLLERQELAKAQGTGEVGSDA